MEACLLDDIFLFFLNIKQVDLETYNTLSTQFVMEVLETLALTRHYLRNKLDSKSDLSDPRLDLTKLVHRSTKSCYE